MTRTIATPEQASDRIGSFLERLRSLDRGELAVLRRNAGRIVAEARNAVGLFYRLLPPGVPERDEEVYFLLATLYGLDNHRSVRDFGGTMRLIRLRTKSKSIDRRVAILLDSEFDLTDGFRPGGGELAYRLRQCVRLAASHEIGVNWEALLHDLLQWTKPGKRVRKQWAKSYYGEVKNGASGIVGDEGGEASC